ncbi:hypothetical protein NQ317_009510 [Molorchus minor]|uniref:RING-type E3 ubiquitin transferase n=1 Tax=Molorchus minor TaxID=1323400 RepID=A0ABQ9J5D1_9CUCU|nr:hypothetical protein NQ317_009510 [Molorchus minor]
MAPKRKSKNTKTLKLLDYKALVLNDVLCPICRSILIEPVTLPCNHVFCSACFDGTMESANLEGEKERKLINYELWKVIENQFPQQVQNKLNGVDENLEEEPQIIVSYPGEIRKEYEVQKQKEDEEVKKRRAEEDKASEELIRKLKDQEDYERAAKEEKLKLDEQIAKKLAKRAS